MGRNGQIERIVLFLRQTRRSHFVSLSYFFHVATVRDLFRHRYQCPGERVCGSENHTWGSCTLRKTYTCRNGPSRESHRGCSKYDRNCWAWLFCCFYQQALRASNLWRCDRVSTTWEEPTRQSRLCLAKIICLQRVHGPRCGENLQVQRRKDMHVAVVWLLQSSRLRASNQRQCP